MSPEPAPPLTELAAMATTHHELYTAYVNAGFREDQAMEILIAVITQGIENNL